MMNNHRITVMFLINQLGTGGAEQQLLDLVRGMDKDRFRPLVATIYSGGSLEAELRSVHGVNLISLNRKGKYDFSIALTVVRLLREWQVDVVQPFLTPATFFGLVGAIANRTGRKVATERGRVIQEVRLGTKLYWAVEDLLARSADFIVANSEMGKSRLIDRGFEPSRIRVIYNGINFTRLMPKPERVVQIRSQMGLPLGGQVVGIVANLRPVKDHATFLRAAALICRVMPQTRFAIVGDGELRPGLESLAKALGVASQVTFFGSQEDVGSYISAFDVACLCSVSEGCSNAILEAQALGRPVVATDVGGNRELVQTGETGILVPAGNPKAMADGIFACLGQPHLARDMAGRALEVVTERFSQSRMVREYQKLYEEVVERDPERHKAFYRRKGVT